MFARMLKYRIVDIVAAPLSRLARQAAFVCLTAWFMTGAIASIHFEEQISPFMHETVSAVGGKTAEFTRLFQRLSPVLAQR